jgi:hypothetical protein
MHCNIGDYAQTIAVKNALETISPNNEYDFYDRDSLTSYYGENIICIMQSWFAKNTLGWSFIPNDKILPIWVGTHFTNITQNFLKYLMVFNREWFYSQEFGCRDHFTLKFLQKHNVPSYLSRCLTLTLPKRKNNGNKIYVVDVPQEFLSYIPDKYKENAIYRTQQFSPIEDQESDWQKYYKTMEDYFEEYKDAKLIITSRLHCASPCTAMGIPVICIISHEEQWLRFSTLQGIIPLYTLNDFKKNTVIYPDTAPNIENLKLAMIKNLDLSVKKALKENINENELKDIREFITNFKV